MEEQGKVRAPRWNECGWTSSRPGRWVRIRFGLVWMEGGPWEVRQALRNRSRWQKRAAVGREPEAENLQAQTDQSLTWTRLADPTQAPQQTYTDTDTGRGTGRRGATAEFALPWRPGRGGREPRRTQILFLLVSLSPVGASFNYDYFILRGGVTVYRNLHIWTQPDSPGPGRPSRLSASTGVCLVWLSWWVRAFVVFGDRRVDPRLLEGLVTTVKRRTASESSQSQVMAHLLCTGSYTQHCSIGSTSEGIDCMTREPAWFKHWLRAALCKLTSGLRDGMMACQSLAAVFSTKHLPSAKPRRASGWIRGLRLKVNSYR